MVVSEQPLDRSFVHLFIVFFSFRSNSDIVVYIQPTDLEKMRQENSLWLGNHRYEVDWLLGWVVTERLGLTGVKPQKKNPLFISR